MPDSTTIDLLRHGRCEGGAIYRGSTDVVLMPMGWQQMVSNSQTVWTQWQAIISSPMLRCTQFSSHVAAELGLESTIEPDFREIHFGQWEGRETDEVWATERDSVKRWMSDPYAYSPPNGELMIDFSARVENAFKRLCQQATGKHIAVITHGGVIRLILSHILGGSADTFNRLDVPYACLSRVKVWHGEDNDYPQLVSHNRAVAQ